MKYYTESQVKNRIKTVEAIEADLETFPAMLFATLRTNGSLIQTQKELNAWCIHLKQKEKMRVAAYGIHTPKHISPHAHILITAFSPTTGRTAANDLSFNALQYHQNQWPRDARLEHLQSNRKAIDYLLSPKNAEITGFDILTFEDKLIARLRKNKKPPGNVTRLNNGLPLIDPAKNDPAAQGRIKKRIRALKRRNGNVIEIHQLQQRLEQLRAS